MRQSSMQGASGKDSAVDLLKGLANDGGTKLVLQQVGRHLSAERFVRPSEPRLGLLRVRKNAVRKCNNFYVTYQRRGLRTQIKRFIPKLPLHRRGNIGLVLPYDRQEFIEIVDDMNSSAHVL